MNLYQHVTSAINRHYKANSTLVLGLSGGVDSRVLLDLMAKYSAQAGVSCKAVFVHHGLSDNADYWAEQCSRWCRELSVPFSVEKVFLDVSSKKSIEDLARQARYKALATHVQLNDLLLTGQHCDDQLETFLLALKRGSGPKGLAAMGECSDFERGYLVRPMLCVSRNSIQDYATEHNLEWVTDESNLDTRFDRNYIRHHVAPVLTERWPSFHQAVNRSAQLCAEQEALLDELLKSHFEDALQADASLDIARLETHSVLIRMRLIRMWFEHLKCKMPSRDQLSIIWNEVALAKPDANPQLNTAGGQVRRYLGKLYLIQPRLNVSTWQSTMTLNQNLELPQGMGVLCIQKNIAQNSIVQKSTVNATLSLPSDADEFLTVRFNPERLSANPIGRNGSRKLKKLFQEYKIAPWLRHDFPIITYKDQVVAVVGLFIDKNFEGQECDVIWDKQPNYM